MLDDSETSLTDLLPLAMAAVDRASRILRERAPGLVTMKGDRDPATEVDYAIERELRTLLMANAPDIGFLGEEEGRFGQNEPGLVWALDPLDGTVNFMNGLPLCAVSLGLLWNGDPVLGVIDLPFMGNRYSAVFAKGAFLNGKRIRASGITNISDAVVALGDYAVGENASTKNTERIEITKALVDQVQRVRMFGSAATDLAWVAEGRIAASVMLANKPWDTAAGVVIAREAGAIIVDRFGRPHTLRSRSTVAVCAGIASQLVPLLTGNAPTLERDLDSEASETRVESRGIDE